MRIVLAAFAVYRLTRFLSFDDGPLFIFRNIREASEKRLSHLPPSRQEGFQGSLNQWITCPYCQGPYYAALVTVLILKPTSMGNALLTWLGLAGMQDFLETIGRKINK